MSSKEKSKVNPLTAHLASYLGKCNCPVCQKIMGLLGDRYDLLLNIVGRKSSVEQPTLLWHFTSKEIKNNVLLPRAAVPNHPKVVWFTKRNNFEPVLLTRDGRPLFKIGVNFDPSYLFNIYHFADKVIPEEFFGVVLSAILIRSNPLDWWVSYRDIPAEMWADAVTLHWV